MKLINKTNSLYRYDTVNNRKDFRTSFDRITDYDIYDDIGYNDLPRRDQNTIQLLSYVYFLESIINNNCIYKSDFHNYIVNIVDCAKRALLAA